jgi:cysteine desulfurase
MKYPIYMDYHATTPVAPEVWATMTPYFQQNFGNAASRQHSFGWTTEEAVAMGREQVAHVLGATSEEIIFTSGATESNNLALMGAAEARRDQGRHVITVATEHKSVLDPLRYLETQGFQVTVLPVDVTGRIDLNQLQAAMTDETILLSVMAANNEIGTLHPLKEIGQLARARNILFHTDAAQACGKIPINVEACQIDLLSLSAHKMYGPKGVGALYVRQGINLVPQMYGGGHEAGLRSGTLNVPGIVGLGKACELATERMSADAEFIGGLRDQLFTGITQGLDGVTLNGPAIPSEERLYNNLNLSFAQVDVETLLMDLRDIAVSSGAACTSAQEEPSHVLQALGISPNLSRASLRFGLGRDNTAEEIDTVISYVIKQVSRLRAKPTRHGV